MDIGETFLLLSVSERQKVIEAFNILKNLGSNATSNDSAVISGTDLKDSVNLLNSTSEKSLKQKTLDNWIVKSKTLSSNCQKELSKETFGSPRNFETEEEDEQTKLDKSSKLDNASTSNKKLVVLLHRQNFESELKTPDHSKLSSAKKSTSPKKIKSPIKKNEHVSENSDQLNLTSEKHSPIPTRSYNLRARGVSDEKTSSGTSHSMTTSAKCEDSHKVQKPIHKSVTKQKPKFKTAFGKDSSLNSSCVEVNFDQKINSYDERTSEEFIKNSECKISSTLVQSELETRSVDSNKIIVIDENPTIVELDLTSVIKEKRKKPCKDKESKKICTSSVVEKSSSIQESGAIEEITMNSKNTKYVQSKKATKLSIVNENPSELSIEKTIQFHRTLVGTSSFQEQISTNDIVKPVSKFKLKKTTKKKDKNELVLHENINLDSTVTKGKKKNLPGQEIYSGIITNIGFQSGISDKQLESTNELEPQIKEYAKDTKSVTSIIGDSKRTSRKRSSENKSTITTENNSLSDPELISKNIDKECITSFDTLSKIFPFQNKELAKETDELLIKEKNTIIPINAKKMCKKKGSENKNKISEDLEQTSKSNDAVIMTPETLSINFSKNSSQSKQFVKDSEEFIIKGKDTVSQIDVNSKRIYRKKSENKSKVAAKTNLISNSELATKNNDKNNISTETSIDSSSNSPSQSKKSVKETEEFLMKSTSTVIPLNINSKRTHRKKSNENKSMVATKNSVKSNSEQSSKTNDKDNSETSLIDSSKNSSIIKDVFTHQINSSATEETVSLNQNNHSSFNPPDLSDDHSRKHSKSLDGSAHNEQKTLIEMKELQEDQSKKSSAVSSNMPEIHVLHTPEISQLTYVSKKVSSLKKKTLNESPGNSRKKLKSAKDENQSNTTQSNFDSLSTQMETFGLNLKSGSKKIITSPKIKLGTDSNKEQLDVPISKSVVNSSHVNTIEEPKDQCLKNSKLNNKLGRTQKEDKKVKNSKKVKENHSKKKNNLQSQNVSKTNLSKHDETTKLNCDLVEDYSKKIKLCKSTSISMAVANNSESGKENHIIRSMEEKTNKVTDFIVDNSNDTDIAVTSFKDSFEFDEKMKHNYEADIAVTSFKDSFEFDEKMKHNYEAFCKVKEVLGAIGISIEELFENPEMINSLKSISPDGVYFINKCKSDSKFSVYMHESKKELRNIFKKLKKKCSEEVK